MTTTAADKAVATYLGALEASEEGRRFGHRLGPNPYRGLRHFDERSAALLTTRNDVSARIRQRFALEQCVFVVGGSGCGKSSLVRGKILEELRNVSRPIPGRDGDWQMISFRPETNPVAQFVKAFWDQIVADAYKPVPTDAYDLNDPVDKKLYQQAEARRAAIRAEIDEGDDAEAARETVGFDLATSGAGPSDLHDGFASAYAWADRINEIATGGVRPAPSNLMIIIDQFEELFRTRVDQDEMEALCAMIRHAYRPEGRQAGVYVAVSMRSEDIHRCAEIEGLADIVNSSVVLVDWLNRADLRRAITDPARLVLRDWGIFGAGHTGTPDNCYPYERSVVDAIEQEVLALSKQLEHRSDHLPLLQHGLRGLWRVAAERWRTIANLGHDQPYMIEQQDLEQIRKRAGVSAKGRWLQAYLRASARNCYKQARAEYREAFPGARQGKTDAATALRAVLSQMASRDENAKFHRDFASVNAVIAERLLPDCPRENSGPSSEAAATKKAIIHSLDIFVAEKLLVKLSSNDDPTYDVTHEALIRNWPKLRQWVDADSELLEAFLASVVDHDGARPVSSKGPVDYEIDNRHLPVLGPVCDWQWSRRIFDSPRWSRPWAWIWNGEQITDGKRISLPWLRRALEERRAGRLGPSGKSAGTANTDQIIDGVKASWRRIVKRRFAINCGSILGVGVLLVVLGVSVDYWNQYQEQKELSNSLVTLMVVNSSELDLAPHFVALDKTKLGLASLSPEIKDEIPHKDISNERIKHIAHVETSRKARDRIGRMAQVAKRENYLQIRQTGVIPGFIGDGEDCAHFDTSSSRSGHAAAPSVLVSQSLRIRLTQPASSQGGLDVDFLLPDEETRLAAISATERRPIHDGLKLPNGVNSVCLSADGRVAAVTFEFSAAPQIYLLDVIKDFRTIKPVVVSVKQLTTSWYPDIGDNKKQLAGESLEITKIPEATDVHGHRTIHFENDGGSYVAYVVEGLSSPMPVKGIEQDFWLQDPGETWLPVEPHESGEPATITCDDTQWSFSNPIRDERQDQGVVREYNVKSIALPGLGFDQEVQLVITSNVATWRVGGGEQHRIAIFNIDMHHKIWDCQPLFLGGFVSSPMRELAFDYSRGRLALNLLDADGDVQRQITLLHDTQRMLDLIELNMGLYNQEYYDSLGSAPWLRLSGALGLEKRSERTKPQ